MKKGLFLFMIFLVSTCCSAQLIKKIGQKAKENVGWRAERRAGQEIDKGLDSLFSMPKKKKDNKAQKQQEADSPSPQKTVEDKDVKSVNKTEGTGNVIKVAPEKEAEFSSEDGFITLKLSTDKIFTYSSILISGESVKYKKYGQVEVTVSGPAVTDVRQLTLTSDNKYAAEWNASDKTGEYTVTVTSSDKKTKQTATFTVEELDFEFADDWPEANIKATQKAYDKLDDAIDNVSAELGSQDKAELEKKLKDIKDKVDDVLKLYYDLNTAAKGIAQLAKSGKRLSPNLYANLSDLNTTLNDHAKNLKRIGELTDHQPAGNTVCEYLVMVNEACAAFSTFTNIYSKSIATIINNIGLDKGSPKLTGMINERFKVLSEPNDFAVKEPAKIFSTAFFDAESLTAKLGTAGFAGDIIQFATDFLMKKYCGVFKGNLRHNYSIEFRNGKGENWWTYGVEMKAALSLRYPKDKTGKVIKMKGNIEGNATRFDFFADVDKEDGFQEASKGKIEVVPIKVFLPLSVSFATSERDVLGFGAIARGMATPAYFNISVDAEYDVEADKIKIFINDALIDFSPFIATQYVFVMFGGDLIPRIKKMTFPIHKARLTINGVIAANNEFAVKKDTKGNISFEGKGNRHIGNKSSERETDLNFTISAKKE